MYQHIIDYYYRLSNVCEKAGQYPESFDYETVAYRYMINQTYIQDQFQKRAEHITKMVTHYGR